jgi:hypothetical protein
MTLLRKDIEKASIYISNNRKFFLFTPFLIKINYWICLAKNNLLGVFCVEEFKRVDSE